MPEGISETVSKKRGRPRLLPDESELSLRALWNDVVSRRGIQNKGYLVRATRLTRDDPQCRWLWVLPGGRIRQTILYELGRITDDVAVVSLARQICKAKLNAKRAVVMLRQFRGVNRPADDEKLTDQIIAVINTYLQAHPDCDWCIVESALQTAAIAVAAEREAQEGGKRKG